MKQSRRIYAPVGIAEFYFVDKNLSIFLLRTYPVKWHEYTGKT